jgi:hypothetical protein
MYATEGTVARYVQQSTINIRKQRVVWCYILGPFSGVKRPGSEFDHSLTPMAKVKNEELYQYVEIDNFIFNFLTGSSAGSPGMLLENPLNKCYCNVLQGI